MNKCIHSLLMATILSLSFLMVADAFALGSNNSSNRGNDSSWQNSSNSNSSTNRNSSGSESHNHLGRGR